MAPLRFDSLLFLCVANPARSQMAEALARARFDEAERLQRFRVARDRLRAQINELALARDAARVSE